jgi:predicted N-acetyltransferase YhbS
MTNTRIRPAKPQDAAVFAALSGQLGYPTTEEDLLGRLMVLCGQDDHLVLSAEKEGRVVGWLHAFVALRIESAAFAEIGGMVVDTSHRGQGLGQQLVRTASAWARIKGIATIRVRSNVVRVETHGFYVRLGFAALKSQQVFAMATGLD